MKDSVRTAVNRIGTILLLITDANSPHVGPIGIAANYCRNAHKVLAAMRG